LNAKFDSSETAWNLKTCAEMPRMFTDTSPPRPASHYGSLFPVFWVYCFKRMLDFHIFEDETMRRSDARMDPESDIDLNYFHFAIGSKDQRILTPHMLQYFDAFC